MQVKGSGCLRVHRLPLMVAGVALLCVLLAGCELDGASKKVATSNKTPQGSAAPRTSLPMPPATTAAQQASLTESGWTMLDGRRANLADYRGQVVVLDFYATYCPPCREEIPHLNALQRRYGTEGVQVIGLNVGGEEDRPKVPKFVQELGISYPLGNPDAALVESFFATNTAIPQTYVFDRRGRLVRRFIGYDSTMPAELETAIQTAVKSDK